MRLLLLFAIVSLSLAARADRLACSVELRNLIPRTGAEQGTFDETVLETRKIEQSFEGTSETESVRLELPPFSVVVDVDRSEKHIASTQLADASHVFVSESSTSGPVQHASLTNKTEKKKLSVFCIYESL